MTADERYRLNGKLAALHGRDNGGSYAYYYAQVDYAGNAAEALKLVDEMVAQGLAVTVETDAQGTTVIVSRIGELLARKFHAERAAAICYAYIGWREG